jgi:XTP/dITP diphosphohydrolase
MKLVFATHNPHKLEEINNILGQEFSLLSLDDINCTEDISEPFFTLEENAKEKTRYIKETYGYDCFADDTGLEIDALNGEPGVFSARYAVPEDIDISLSERFRANIQKVLGKLKGVKNRRARFRTVISLNWSEGQFLFEGVVEGNILTEPTGDKGFGYDPIFMPLGYSKSFAEMTLDEKNLISHRAVAFNQLRDFLRTRI